nr:MAG TPA: hypothetical protein [Caudoviricetes sp.]
MQALAGNSFKVTHMLILVQRNQRQIVIYSYRLQLVKNSEVNRLR